MFIQITFGFNMSEWPPLLLMERSLFLKILNKNKLSTTLLELKICTTLPALKNFQKDFSWPVIKVTWRCGFDAKKIIKVRTKKINYSTLFDVGESQILSLLLSSLWTLTQVRSILQLLVETITFILFMSNQLGWMNRWTKKLRLISLQKDFIQDLSRLLMLQSKDL